MTFEGLRALGTSAASRLATFPSEFAAGMTAQALKLGDFGDSAPEHWPAPFDRPERVHIIATAYAGGEGDDEAEAAPRSGAGPGGAGVQRARRPQRARLSRTARCTSAMSTASRSQTFPQEARGDLPGSPPIRWAPCCLGHPTSLEGLMFRVPEPADLGLNGTFNAFRVLAQDARVRGLPRPCRRRIRRIRCGRIASARQCAEYSRRLDPNRNLVRDCRRTDVWALAKRRAVSSAPNSHFQSTGVADQFRL